MPQLIEKLYKVKKKDIQKAGIVLADAFQQDPIWKKVLKDFNSDQRCLFFESAIIYSLKYGKVYATSKQIEGIAAWIPYHLADMTIWRSIRSGSFFSFNKNG
jgi:hypothetical protein